MGKKSHKTTTTSKPPDWAVGPLSGGMGDILSIERGNQGNLANLESGLTGSLGGLQQQIGNTQTQLQPAMGYANDVLGGKYLNSNPYIDAMVHQGEQDAGNSVNSAFSSAGRTGSLNNVKALAQGVANAGNNIRNQDYQFERQQQGNAAAAMPSLTAAQFSGYQPLLGGYQLAGQLPYYGTNALGNLGGMVGGFGTQSGTQPGGWGTALGGILGAGLSGWASGGFAGLGGASGVGWSDRRLKTNIKKVGEAKDGLGIYEWNWKAFPDGEKVKGVIADEVRELRPWAYVENYRDGFDGVNYAALGSLE